MTDRELISLAFALISALGFCVAGLGAELYIHKRGHR
jgi:hypothetical protein